VIKGIELNIVENVPFGFQPADLALYKGREVAYTSGLLGGGGVPPQKIVISNSTTENFGQ
jgi:hypothetical protein